jgi:signal transduction histidine kinase/ActR/RegA family two-component response regulator
MSLRGVNPTLQALLAIFRPNPELDSVQAPARLFTLYLFGIFCAVLSGIYLLHGLSSGVWLSYSTGAKPLLVVAMALMSVFALWVYVKGVNSRADTLVATGLFLIDGLWLVGFYLNGLMALAIAPPLFALVRMTVVRWIALTLFTAGCLGVAAIMLLSESAPAFHEALRYLITLVVVFILVDQLLVRPQASRQETARAVSGLFLYIGLGFTLFILLSIGLGWSEGSLARNLIFLALVIALLWCRERLPLKPFVLMLGFFMLVFHTLSFSSLETGQLELPFVFVYFMVGLLVLPPLYFGLYFVVITFNVMRFLLSHAQVLAPLEPVLINLALGYLMFCVPVVQSLWRFVPQGVSAKVNLLITPGAWQTYGNAWLLRMAVGVIITHFPLFVMLNTAAMDAPLVRFMASWYGYFWLLSLWLIIGALSYLLARRDYELTQAAVLFSTSQQSDSAKMSLLTGINHNIRSPLNNVIAGITSLMRQPELPSKVAAYLEIIQNSADKLFRLMGNMIDARELMRGAMSFNRAPFALPAFVDSVMLAHRPMAEALNVTLSVDRAQVPNVIVEGDELRCAQIINNILANAIKFSPNGRVKMFVVKREQGLRFTIADNGQGMDEATQQRVFKLFQQADNSLTRQYQGLGLGLNISMELLKRMGGELHCDSALGRGSVFTIDLPLSVVGEVESMVNASYAQQPSKRPTRLLLVDDDRITLMVMKHLLEDDFAVMESCSSALEALQHLQVAEFDVVLADIAMPEMNGVEFLHTLRQRGITLPVIALTGNALRHELEEYRAQGFSAVLAKPANRETLLTCIDDLWASYRENKPC